MRIAVIGYGNLGRSVEKAALEKGHELAGIFSRRKIKSASGTPTFSLESFANAKADIAAICLGSADDIPGIAPVIALQCNTVDAYDNHSEMRDYHRVMDNAAKSSGHVCLLGLGWDTGIFSAIRCLNCLVGDTQGTFWGKGISRGHSNALRTIEGVEDAVQFTLPNNKAKNKQSLLEDEPEKRHRRICYIAAEENADKLDIVEKTVNMPSYFKGYDTEVYFVDKKTLDGLKNDGAHRGEILCYGDEVFASYKIRMKDNCDLTARIMVEGAAAATSMAAHGRYGAFTAAHIPPSEYLGDRVWDYI